MHGTNNNNLNDHLDSSKPGCRIALGRILIPVGSMLIILPIILYITLASNTGEPELQPADGGGTTLKPNATAVTSSTLAPASSEGLDWVLDCAAIVGSIGLVALLIGAILCYLGKRAVNSSRTARGEASYGSNNSAPSKSIQA